MERPALGEFLRTLLVEHLQKKEEHAIERIFSPYLDCGEEPTTKDVLEKAGHYVPESFEGEAILTVGKAIDAIEKGVSGVINTMPFTCMPGTIGTALLRRVQKKHDVPMITLAYDGQGETNVTTRLEAFVYQVKERWDSGRGRRDVAS
jgi:predicted nucleotide-binding protein (sugar kinase/HSP70/actin superfamily)